jgi:PAS domain S-box-containing protein
MESFATVMLDAAGNVELWNARAQRMFGYPDDAIVGQHASRLYEAVGTDAFAALLRVTAAAGSAEHEGRCVRRDGGRFSAQSLLTALKENGGTRGYALIVHELNARQRSAERRRDDESRLDGILQSAMDAIITVDEKQDIVLFNAAAENMFRCPAADVIGASLDRFLPARFREAHRSHIGRFGETGVTTRRMGDQTVLYALRADGEEFPIEASISQVTVGGNRLYTVILRDITDRVRTAGELERSHRHLTELYSKMHDVREAERTRIARELHDELAQRLTALKMDVSWLASRLPRGAEHLVARTEKMKGGVDALVAGVRRIASDLRPAMLDDLGLLPAVEHLLHEFSERTGIMITLDAEVSGVEFREPLATAIYRILQETLTNVARHAAASEVQVAIRLDGDRLVMRARDNGKGIDSTALQGEKSFGILGIRERAQTLGGHASVYGPPEGGTVVEITLPATAYRVGEQCP